MFQTPNDLKFRYKTYGFPIGHAFTPHRVYAGNNAQRPNAFTLLKGCLARLCMKVVLNDATNFVH
jgi:hypothetical protein